MRPCDFIKHQNFLNPNQFSVNMEKKLGRKDGERAHQTKGMPPGVSRHLRHRIGKPWVSMLNTQQRLKLQVLRGKEATESKSRDYMYTKQLN